MRKGQKHPCALPGDTAAMRQHARNYKYNAKAKGLVWEIAEEDFRRLCKSDCAYCGRAAAQEAKSYYRGGRVATPFVCNGLDRIDNTQGYTFANVVACCKQCNIAKNNWTFDEFKAWIAACYARLYGAT